MNYKKNITLMTVIISVILMIIGISFAYFTANLTGQEDATSITVGGGTMSIIYNGGADINVVGILPSDNPAVTKTFTVTGNNTTIVSMSYQINFVIDENTFSNEALKYKLISTNNDNNGSVVPEINDMQNIGSETSTINLGVGEFISPTDGDKVHTYNLEIYFIDINGNQNEDQGKELKAHIEITNNIEPISLQGIILAQGGGASVIENKGNPDFTKISTTEDSGIYQTLDEYGTSYYYRGNRDLLNNNLIWGGFQWKIIRVNGDGSIRIIYNGTETDFNESGQINVIGLKTLISEEPWNENNSNDNKYLGYMYGGENGVASTSREEATNNQTSNATKRALDLWYQETISGKSFENQIADNIFCNDRQLRNEVGGQATGTGYGNSTTYYANHHRIYDNKNPTLKCEQKNNRFTNIDTILGNGSLTYPVGLITADEAAFTGMLYAQNNESNYLNNSLNYWTMTPAFANPTAYMWRTNTGGALGYSPTNISGTGLRPVINLNSNVTVTGDGSATNPFRVVI